MRSKLLACFVVFSFLVPWAAAADGRPVAMIAQGAVAGVADGGVSFFKGIPYAAPPVGDSRWRPPRPHEGWSGRRDASEFGNVCPQVLRPGYSTEVLGARPMSEDCLHLNVWTTAVDPEAKLPVMVWLLPGGFLMGDTSMPRYDGTELARQGVVVVTFNYRLGMLGQFAHPSLRRSQPDEPAGNYHMMDQVAALEWVRDNIRAFGGDPGNVTIFGMSAGGVSVNYHMVMPSSAGLFHRAISESSAIRVSRPRHITEDLPGVPSLETEFIGVAEELGVTGDDETVVTGLRALTVEQILDYQANNMLGVGGSLNPVLDGRIVTEAVGAAFRDGRQHKVPYLTGATSWEGSLLGWASSSEPVLRLVNISQDDARALYGETSDYRSLNNKLYVDLFLGSQRYLAHQHATSGAPAFVYYFNRVLDDHLGELPGAAHGAEMRYVFKTLDSLRLLGAGSDFGNRPSDVDRRYADVVSGYWVQFAVDGNPNRTGLPGWPALTPGNDLILEFGQTGVAVRRDFRPHRWAFWASHFDSGRL